MYPLIELLGVLCTDFNNKKFPTLYHYHKLFIEYGGTGDSRISKGTGERNDLLCKGDRTDDQNDITVVTYSS